MRLLSDLSIQGNPFLYLAILVGICLSIAAWTRFLNISQRSFVEYVRDQVVRILIGMSGGLLLWLRSQPFCIEKFCGVSVV